MQVDLAKIRRLRKEADLTQGDMAKALGYRSGVGYLHVEKGHVSVTVERLGSIANVLGVPITDLLVQPAPAQEVSAS